MSTSYKKVHFICHWFVTLMIVECSIIKEKMPQVTMSITFVTIVNLEKKLLNKIGNEDEWGDKTLAHTIVP